MNKKKKKTDCDAFRDAFKDSLLAGLEQVALPA